MLTGVVQCEVEVLEQVILVRKVVERAHGGERAAVIRFRSFDQHRDASGFELGDDFAEGLRSGGVEDLDIG